MRIAPHSKRKAISPVLATVILIAITLIAAIAIAGFVFGLFGTFTSTARVQASVTQCVASTVANQEDCTLILTNTGNANVNTTPSCSMTYKGSSYNGVISAAGNAAVGAAQAVNSGASATVHCTTTSATAAAGAGVQVTGAMLLGNGGNALFSATASS